MGEVIRNRIVTDIKSSGGWFYFSADEVQDVSNKEQLSITVRFADIKGNIREEFMAFEDVSGDTSGLNLSERLLLSLQKFELDPEKMRSQCYDGAGNMMGKLKGVGPRIQSQFPKAVPFWCTAHRLNRCIIAATNIQMVRNMMGFADKAASFFNDSTKRQKSLETQLDEVKSENLRMKLKALCRTRWVERHEIFIELLPATVGALTSIQQSETRTDALADTSGLLHSITSFQFIICLVVVQQCLGYLKQLSIFLQGRALGIVRAFHMVNYIKVALQEVRDEVDSYHSQWFQQAVNLAREVGTKPSVPRTFKKQTQRDNTESSCAEEYYRRTLTIPFVDHLNTELEARFSDLQQKASLGLLLLPPSAEHASELTDKLDYFSEDLPSPNTIKQEIHMWNLKWNNSNMMKPDTLEKALKECDQSFFPNINAILRICCVFPVTSAECERSISVLRLIKNYLRSTMGQERVSALCLMFIHRDINIDPTEVVTIFSQRNPRRMLLPDVLCDPR